MRMLSWAKLLSLAVVVLTSWAEAIKPISNIQVTLRGKKYDIQDVTTVGELQERLSEASGVEPSRQGRVLFNGKRLDATESLSTAGVSSGDQLNVVPGKVKPKSTTSSSAAAGQIKKTEASTGKMTSSGTGKKSSKSATSTNLENMLKGSGVDTSKLDDMLKNLGVGGAGGPSSLKESMAMMTEMMKSPLFKEFMDDPEKLEQVRQMILQNPMLKAMMGSMPGIEEILNSPTAWKEAMQAAAMLYQNMDQDTLMNMLMNEGGGMNMPGSFNGAGLGGSEASSFSALDDMSEDD